MNAIRDILSSYQTIVLLESRWLGIAIAAAAFLHPNIALSGLLGIGAGLVVLRALELVGQVAHRTTCLFNALLIGLFIGGLYVLDGVVAGLIALSAGLTVVTSIILGSRLAASGLPALSLPFSLVALLIAFSARRFSGLADASYYFSAADLSGYLRAPPAIHDGLRSMGALFCIPDPLFGALLMAFIGLRSPLTAAFFTLGHGIGTGAERLLSFNAGVAPPGTHGFNYSLTFAAVAGGFLIPSRFSFLWAAFATLIGVLLSVSASAILDAYHIPVMALPFNLAVLLVLGALRVTNPARLCYSVAAAPEAALERSRSLWLRHRTGEIGVFCPFEGPWSVQQGFDGPWTHRGYWRHALDFVVQGPNGKTFERKGIELADYFAFERPVLAPIAGVVARVCGSLADNPIGQVDNKNNWGNYVIIRGDGGVHVVLAHLRKDSIEVAAGDPVTVGQQVARCGNSGYSQEPHLHLQAQTTDLAGAYAVPFHLVNFKVGNRAVFHGTPLQGERVEPLSLSVVLDRLLSFRLGESVEWATSEPWRGARVVSFSHLLDERSGRYYWTDGRARVYYSKTGAQFYFYGLEGERWSPLWDLFAAAPRLPLCFGERVEFAEALPLWMSHHSYWRLLALSWQLVSSRFYPGSAKYVFDPTRLEMRGEVVLKGTVTSTFLKMDPAGGIMEFSVGNRRYVRE